MKRGPIVGLVVAAVLLLGVGGAIAAVTLGNDAPDAVGTSPTESSASKAPETDATEEATSDDEPEQAPAEEPAATDDDAASTPGAYVDYSPEALAAAQGQRILFFHADWCPTCHTLEANIKKQGVPDGITFLKVDYDSNQELRQKYGVTIQTTVVALDDSGEASALFVPYESPTLDAALEGLNLR